MNLEKHDKQQLSNVRMQRAYEFLADAKANLSKGRFKTAVNRSYYAVLSAVRALLILEGANPETHEDTVTLLSLRLIRPKILPIEVVKQVKILYSRRTDVNYGDFATINKEEAVDSVEKAEGLIKSIENVRLSYLK